MKKVHLIAVIFVFLIIATPLTAYADMGPKPYIYVTKEQNNWAESLSLAILRIVLTLLIEIAIALIFKIKGRKSILVIAVTNVLTQLFLNAGLLIIQYLNGGGYLLLISYFVLEVTVLIIESVVYSITLCKTNNPPVGAAKAIVYAVAANLASLVTGFFIG